jgi:hypothetical protein
MKKIKRCKSCGRKLDWIEEKDCICDDCYDKEFDKMLEDYEKECNHPQSFDIKD